jgi:hypothetical protein
MSCCSKEHSEHQTNGSSLLEQKERQWVDLSMNLFCTWYSNELAREMVDGEEVSFFHQIKVVNGRKSYKGIIVRDFRD